MPDSVLSESPPSPADAASPPEAVADGPAAASPVLDVRRLIADGRHNAFTDLFRWRGTLYLTHRRSSGHGATDGDIVLLRSEDGERWEQTPTGLRSSHNFYEGHLAQLGDRLFMFGGAFRRGGKLDKSTQQQFVSWTDDGVHWSSPTPIYQPRWRFWRPIRVGDALFAAAYHVDLSDLGPDGRIPPSAWTVRLVRSDDGVTWRDVSVLSQGQGANESALFAEPDGRLTAWCRCDAGPCHMIQYVAEPPYDTWQGPIDAGQDVKGQFVGEVNGRRFLIGRHIPCHSRHGTIFCRRDWIRTRIWVWDRGYWVEYATLPSGGDCSYAAAVPIGDDRMLVSYYSQHAYVNQPGFEDMGGASDIYLATVRTDAPAEWGSLAAGGQRALLEMD